MPSIDDRIVRMRFENTNFQSGAKKALGTLDSLKKKLNFSDATKGMADLKKASNSFNMGNMGGAVDGLSGKFIALSTVAITALSRITNSAITAGKNLANALFVDSKKAGFDEYELKMGSIQTIMAGSGASLKEVNQRLEELNLYADKTIYSFADMTSNIGKFTNAGVSLKKSVAAIKGISNVAALSGANANEASRAMYNFSQALSAGHVKLIDWKSIELANMATKGFKEELIKTAVEMGTLTKTTDGMYKTLEGKTLSSTKGFNESLTDQWLTSKALTATLEKYSDETTKLGKKASAAAQDVKTFSQMIDTMKEGAGSGWARTWELIFGNFNESKKLWTGVNDVVGGIIERQANARNKMLAEWKKAGGRKDLMAGIANIWKALAAVIGPIHEAFREIFPPTTGKELAEITEAFRKFTEMLIISEDSQENLKRTFKGLFAVIHIFTTLISNVIGYLFGFFGLVDGGSGGFLSLTGAIGDFLVKLDEWIAKSGAIDKFFAGLSVVRAAVLGPLFDALGLIFGAIGKLASGDIDSFVDGFANGLNSLASAAQGVVQHVIDMVANFTSFEGIGKMIGGVLDVIGRIGEKLSFKFGLDFSGFNSNGVDNVTAGVTRLKDAGIVAGSVFKKLGDFFGPILKGIGEIIGALHGRLVSGIENADIFDAMALGNAAALTGLFLMFRKFMKNLDTITGSITGVFQSVSGVFNQIGGVFYQLSEGIKVLQQQAKVDMLMKIAISIAILAGSLLILASIDPKRLGVAMGALAGLFTSLLSSLALISKLDPVDVKLNLLVGSLIALSIAIFILAAAVKKLSSLNWEELAKGLIGTAGLLLALGLFTKFADANAGGIRSGAGLILLAVAIRLLAESVEKLGGMDLGTLFKGVAAIGALILALGYITQVMSNTSGIFAAATGLLVLSVALLALSYAIEKYAEMDWTVFGKGLLLAAGALLAIGMALRSFPRDMEGLAARLVVMSLALVIMAKALGMLGGMSLGELIKSLSALGVSLWMLSAALVVMARAEGGAKALLISAAAITILAGALKVLGGMDLLDIVKALGAIAGVFVLLGVASLVLGPMLPIVHALAIAFAIFGGGMLAVGAGMMLLGMGLTVLAATGTAAWAVIMAGFEMFLAFLPLFITQFGLAIMAMVVVIRETGPPLIAALGLVLKAFLDEIISLIPKVADTFITLVKEALRAIRETVPDIISTAFFIITEFLTALGKNAKKITKAGIDIVLGVAEGIQESMPRIVKKGFDLLISFLEGIRDGIRKRARQITHLGIDIAGNLIAGVIEELLNSVRRLWNAIRELLSKAWANVRQWAENNKLTMFFKNPWETIKNLVTSAWNSIRDWAARNPITIYVVRKLKKEGTWEKFSADDLPEPRNTNPPDTTPRTPSGRDPSEPRRRPTNQRPITDLNKRSLNSLFAQAMSVEQSRRAATAISSERQAQAEREAMAEAIKEAQQPTIEFNQNNYSPKALSPVEVYRQTRNQLSMAKEVLARHD